MTIYKLKSEYERTHPNGHWFDSDTLKFFGERLSEMRVLSETAIKKDWKGDAHTCYVVSKLSRNYPGGKRRTYAYFDVETYDEIQD